MYDQPLKRTHEKQIINNKTYDYTQQYYYK